MRLNFCHYFSLSLGRKRPNEIVLCNRESPGMEYSPIRSIRAAYSIIPPFVTEEEDENGDIIVGGIMPAFLETVSDWMNFSVTFVKEPNNQYGSLVNNTWTGMCGMIFRNEVDIILNPLSPQDNFIDIVYYTNPIIIEAYTTLSGKKSEEIGLFVYFSVLSPQVWGGLGISLFFIAITSMLLYQIMHNAGHLTWLNIWWEYIWFFFTAMLNQGPNEKWVPRENKSRTAAILSLLWTIWAIGIAFLVMNIFQTQLFSKLTIVKSEPFVKTLDDFASKVNIYATTAKEIDIHEVLQDSGIPLYEKVWKRVEHTMMDMDTMFSDTVLDDVERGKISMIHGHLILESVLKDRFERKGTCNFYMMEEYFLPFGLLMALKRTLPDSFLAQFNLGLTRLLAADLTGKWFKSIEHGYRLCTGYHENTLKPLNLNNIFGVLLLWGAGLCVATLTLVGEIMYCRMYKDKAHNRNVLSNGL